MKTVVNAPSLDLIQRWEALDGEWEDRTHVYPVKSGDGGYGGKPDVGQRLSQLNQVRGHAPVGLAFAASNRGVAQLRVTPGGALVAHVPKTLSGVLAGVPSFGQVRLRWAQSNWVCSRRHCCLARRPGVVARYRCKAV